MKSSFIELNQSGTKVLINLQNVTRIVRFKTDTHTHVYFNCTNDKSVPSIDVFETYEEIKKLIGMDEETDLK